MTDENYAQRKQDFLAHLRAMQQPEDLASWLQALGFDCCVSGCFGYITDYTVLIALDCVNTKAQKVVDYLNLFTPECVATAISYDSPVPDRWVNVEIDCQISPLATAYCLYARHRQGCLEPDDHSTALVKKHFNKDLVNFVPVLDSGLCTSSNQFFQVLKLEPPVSTTVLPDVLSLN